MKSFAQNHPMLTEAIAWSIILSIIVLFSCAISHGLTQDRQRKADRISKVLIKEFQIEAISKGHASWVTDTNSLPVFAWNESCGE